MQRAADTGSLLGVGCDVARLLLVTGAVRRLPRAIVGIVFVFVARRATTRRFVCGWAGCVAFDVAARAVVLEFLRGTTRRVDVASDNGLVFTTTSIGLVDCDTVTPGFRSVRI